MPDERPVLAVVGLRKEYPVRDVVGQAPIVAVDDVSFSVAAGESLAIVGESGSGKTTVARMVVGLEQPTAGDIEVCGRSRSARARRASVRRQRATETQIVFQNPYASLDPRQRVRDALREALRARQREDSDATVSALLEQVGLEDRHGRSHPRALSGGQRQRVAIARALAAEPKLLILDEAVAALDVSVQAQVLNLLADIREHSAMSYLFISHDLAVVRQLCSRAVVMRDGRVVEQGSTADILERPETTYTQLLRDSVPRPGWKPSRRLLLDTAAEVPT